MFKIVRAPRAWWPVTFKLPDEDGKLVEHKFEMRFRLLKVDQAMDFIADAARADQAERAAFQRAASTAPAASEAEHQALADLYAELVERIADDWREVAGENGEALPWSRANLAALLNEPGMFLRISDAFQDCLAGREKVREGN